MKTNCLLKKLFELKKESEKATTASDMMIVKSNFNINR